MSGKSAIELWRVYLTGGAYGTITVGGATQRRGADTYRIIRCRPEELGARLAAGETAVLAPAEEAT